MMACYDDVMPQTTTVRLPDDLYEHYRQQAFELRTSMNALIIAALYSDAQTVKAGR